jgi:hypothetical protein
MKPVQRSDPSDVLPRVSVAAPPRPGPIAMTVAKGAGIHGQLSSPRPDSTSRGACGITDDQSRCDAVRRWPTACPIPSHPRDRRIPTPSIAHRRWPGPAGEGGDATPTREFRLTACPGVSNDRCRLNDAQATDAVVWPCHAVKGQSATTEAPPVRARPTAASRASGK